MLTRTLPSQFEEKISQKYTTQEIEEQVDERWFYLHEWISPDELRMSVQADYLSIIRKSSMPLAVIALIFWFLWLWAGTLGVIMAVFWVLAVFYTVVLFILIVKMFYKAYLYTKWGDLVITDNHYVSLGKVVERKNFDEQKTAFASLEKVFREPLLEPSWLAEHITLEKKNLFDQLKDIAYGWGKIVENLGRSRDAGWIMIVLVIVGILYGIMMAGVYFIGVFFVTILAQIFSWIAHRILLAVNNTEYEIQTFFKKILESSIALKQARKESVSLLDQANQNEWKDNLSGKLSNSFEEINNMASKATDDSIKLRKLLESSKYKDIFNFLKYGNWTKKQILDPIEEILLLLKKNHDILTKTFEWIKSQILNTKDPALQKPLILQKERLEIQVASLAKNRDLLLNYKEKLQ